LPRAIDIEIGIVTDIGSAAVGLGVVAGRRGLAARHRAAAGVECR
jgi:hypothetical protein